MTWAASSELTWSAVIEIAMESYNNARERLHEASNKRSAVLLCMVSEEQRVSVERELHACAIAFTHALTHMDKMVAERLRWRAHV